MLAAVLRTEHGGAQEKKQEDQLKGTEADSIRKTPGRSYYSFHCEQRPNPQFVILASCNLAAAHIS